MGEEEAKSQLGKKAPLKYCTIYCSEDASSRRNCNKQQ
jgi:hypothetical protein